MSRLARLSDADAAEIDRARKAFDEAKKAVGPTQALFDILAASRLDEEIRGNISPGAIADWMDDLSALVDSRLHKRAQEVLEAIPPFHFPIAFPGVFLRERAGLM